MAKFKVGDWVEITPNPDKFWELWDEKIHDHYCSKIGQITAMSDDIDDDADPYCQVSIWTNIFSPNPIDYNWYYAMFKARHLVLSTQYDAKLRQNREQVEKELQEWEETKRKKTDDALRSVFTRPTSIRRGGTKKSISPSSVPSPVIFEEDWEEKTPVDNDRVTFSLPDLTEEEMEELNRLFPDAD